MLMLALCLTSLVSGDATSGASSRLALQGGAVTVWLRGCLVVATWPMVVLDLNVFGDLWVVQLGFCTVTTSHFAIAPRWLGPQQVE